MGRLGTPQELTGIASFLLSPDGGFITGQVIHIDGGRTLV
jgi:NAD(P)-dependent dehydrogenase (short-subunit alcohol dehydrogenase family)